MMDIEEIKEISRLLDAADVPKTGRTLRFIGKDGKEYIAYTDKPNTKEVIKALNELFNGLS